jgi:hypothetical protein
MGNSQSFPLILSRHHELNDKFRGVAWTPGNLDNLALSKT